MEIPIVFGVEEAHPREWFIILDKNLYVLKDAGLEWFEKHKKGLETIGFVWSQVNPCVWYKEEMFQLFYVDDCLMLSPYKDKIDELYANLQAYFKI